MITIYKRGTKFWARGSHHGCAVRPRSLDTQSRQVAEKRRTDYELELDAGITRVSWADFELRVITETRRRLSPNTQRLYEFVLHRFRVFLAGAGITALGAVTPAVISDYLHARASDTHPTRHMCIGAEGIKSDLRVLHAAFAVAVRAGHLQKNPIRYEGLATNPRGTQPFTAGEVTRMISDTKARARADLLAIVLAFVSTGFRISDIIGLAKQDVDLALNQIVRRTQKRGKTVYLPLHPELKDALLAASARQTPSQRSSTLLFPTKTGRPIRSLDSMLRIMWKRCGVIGGHAHRFRDTFAVRLLASGASLYDVAKLLGITVAVAERHYAPYVEELRERGRRFVLGLEFAEADPRGAIPCATILALPAPSGLGLVQLRETAQVSV